MKKKIDFSKLAYVKCKNPIKSTRKEFSEKKHVLANADASDKYCGMDKNKCEHNWIFSFRIDSDNKESEHYYCSKCLAESIVKIVYEGRILDEIIYLKQKEVCENCEQEEVENKGDWCDDCNLPERSTIK